MEKPGASKRPKAARTLKALKMQKMLEILKITIPALLMGIINLTPAHGAAIPPMDYQGYMIYKGPNGAFSYKIYVGSLGIRTEGTGTVQITRPDLGVVWTTRTADRTYQEQPINGSYPYFSPEGVPGTLTESYAGDELVGGVRCQKFLVTRAAGGGKEDLIRWVDPKNGLTLKVGDRYGRWSMEIRNPRHGTLPKGLFEVPKGYKKVEP